jgi:hypothetical protein
VTQGYFGITNHQDNGPGSLALGNTFVFTAINYTPAWTSAGATVQPALGNATLLAEYIRLGPMVTAVIQLTAGSTTTFGTGGTYRFSLPFNLGGSSGATYQGSWSIAIGAIFHVGTVTLVSPNLMALLFENTSGVGPASFTFAAGNVFRMAVTFAVAPTT